MPHSTLQYNYHGIHVALYITGIVVIQKPHTEQHEVKRKSNNKHTHTHTKILCTFFFFFFFLKSLCDLFPRL